MSKGLLAHYGVKILVIIKEGLMKIKIAAIFMLMTINYSALAQSTVLFIGDSLTAGYGVKKENS